MRLSQLVRGGAVVALLAVPGLTVTLVQGAVAQQAGDTAPDNALTIGVVIDGPAPEATLIAALERELAELYRGNLPTTFKRDPAFNGGWTSDGAAAALAAALADDEVDLIVARGALVAEATANLDPLTKPVVLAFLQRGDLFQLLDANDVPRRDNVSFLVAPQTVAGDILAFRDMIPFERAFIVVDAPYVPLLRNFDSVRRQVEADTGVAIEYLGMQADGTVDLASVDASSALMLLTAEQLRAADVRAVLERAKARRVPVFSLRGHSDVELGALASRVPDPERLIARRLALNIRDILRGRPTQDLPVYLPGDTRLVVNGETAQAIGYSPSVEYRAYAEILHPEALALDAEPLDLRLALEYAEGGNVDIRIAEQVAEISDRDRQLAKTQFLPQIFFEPQFLWTDAAQFAGILPDRSVTLGLGARQMIWDQPTVSAYKSQTSLWEGTQQQIETRRLDAWAGAGRGFYSLGRAEALYLVQLEDLRLTESNLQLGRLRRDVGFSGRDEVLRWEAELATSRGNVLRAVANIETTRIRLNQVLGTDQARRWTSRVPDINPDIFPFLDGRLSGLEKNTRAMAVAREFLVQFAFENAPELRTIDKGIEAQEYQLEERQRRWWLPSFFAQGSYTYRAASSPPLEDVQRGIPLFTINATYPLFVGGARSEEVARATSEISRLSEEQILARQLIERRVRTSVHRLESSFPGIRLADEAAVAANENLIIVQERYIQGLVNVTDLLEAQSARFAAEQNRQIAAYRFLLDFIEFQRSIAWFEVHKTEQEKAALARRIQEAIQ